MALMRQSHVHKDNEIGQAVPSYGEPYTMIIKP